ncbi:MULTISPECIES: twin-arginine translocation signal domain-containing protein [Ferrimonas]|uniref:Formate dehydrogenase region TAT target n=1 Tax=Ferrimonas sediminum TaxID=718193 RepID=A0A1G8JI72_9GAMM|nr:MULTISPECIES: twin-arginine translocation signal domain-containing protein [Ferrimonas]USD37509.1 twin-arginine translocation signal domain-containing protein [Ferrimonas sp. SCSIO 43195]SDI30812.1 formate dehydrogenase region TAT target [Ferrimonas sediminum]
MTNKTQQTRRAFLKNLGLGTAAATAAAAVTSTQAVAATPAHSDEKPSGYRESDHVRSYYASLRGQ